MLYVGHSLVVSSDPDYLCLIFSIWPFSRQHFSVCTELFWDADITPTEGTLYFNTFTLWASFKALLNTYNESCIRL